MATYVAHEESQFAPPAEVGEPELYHPKTFIGKYVWSQDAKIIAIQYAITAIGIGLVALVFSWLMRLASTMRKTSAGRPTRRRKRARTSSSAGLNHEPEGSRWMY